jgi:major membrane immunogen (membrane-anchored lipoprotein)
MKKLLIGILAVVLFAGAANAQQVKEKHKEKGDHAMMEHQMDHQMDQLGLTTEQKDRIVAINNDFRTKMQNLKNENLSQEDRRTRMHELQQQHMQSIRSVLNTKQQAKFDTMAKEHMNMMGQEGKHKYKMKADKGQGKDWKQNKRTDSTRQQ